MTDNPLFHRRLLGWEQYDQVVLTVVPRYKTSELSGDEWRTSVLVAFMFKGKVIKQDTYSKIETAVLCLGRMLINDEGLGKEYLKIEEATCDQPGCANPAVARLEIGKLVAEDGSWLDPKEKYGRYYRKFCTEHIKRGDCDREDCDDNYTPLDDAVKNE